MYAQNGVIKTGPIPDGDSTRETAEAAVSAALIVLSSGLLIFTAWVINDRAVRVARDARLAFQATLLQQQLPRQEGP